MKSKSYRSAVKCPVTDILLYITLVYLIVNSDATICK